MAIELRKNSAFVIVVGGRTVPDDHLEFTQSRLLMIQEKQPATEFNLKVIQISLTNAFLATFYASVGLIILFI
jgi:hypothetical protein